MMISKKISAIFNKIKRKYELFRFKVTPVHREVAGLNIIFFLPFAEQPPGGNIVTHHHSDRINQLNIGGVKALLMYPENINHTPTKFIHQSLFKQDYSFDPDQDFVILAEAFVIRYHSLCQAAGIKYGIHVQNGYLMDIEIRAGFGDYAMLKQAYANAEFVIGNSSDTITNIKYAFPDIPTKLIRSYFVINKARVQPIEAKQNLITYMPRKLAQHSKHVLFFLGDKLPKHWKIMPIDGVSEQTVYDIFYQSKIFLSFSEFEGLAMPPAMAALSGNHVIGYTGEANKEYFHLPCFEEVACGDVKLFVDKIIDAINRFDLNQMTIHKDALYELQHLFSEQNQEVFLNEMVQQVKTSLS